MAIYHLSVKTIGRSKGRSAVACAAYRSGTKLYDEETRQTHDFTRKCGVKFSTIVLPKNAPAEYADRETLWNAVQNMETRSNARLAREFEPAIPNELPFDLQIRCLMEFAQHRADEGMIIDVNYHKRHKKKNDEEEEKENDHGHLMATTRGFDANGKWAPKEKKMYARDENGNKIPLIDPKTGLQKVRVRPGKVEEKLWKQVTVEANDWNKRENMELWRADWAEICNRALIEIGSSERIDHRSYKRQGIIDLIPTKHEGVAAREMEKRGEKSELCEYNREVRKANAEIENCNLEIEKYEAEKQEIIDMIDAAERAKTDREKEKAAGMERIAQEQAKQVFTAEEKAFFKEYYRDAAYFFPGYRELMKTLTAELDALYNDEGQKAAYIEFRRAKWVYEHSEGIEKIFARINLNIAKEKVDPGAERMRYLKDQRAKLGRLCGEALANRQELKIAKERQTLTGNVLTMIARQQVHINNQLAAMTDEFSTEIQVQQDAIRDALKCEESYTRTRELVSVLNAVARGEMTKEEAQRITSSLTDIHQLRDEEHRRQTYGDLIKAQAEWVRVNSEIIREQYTDQYEKDSAALKIAIADVESARSAERDAADALEHAGIFGKKAKKAAFEKARKKLSDAIAGLSEFGVKTSDAEYEKVVQSARTLLGQTNALAEKERAKLKKEPIEEKTKRAAAERKFKELCQAVPESQRAEAERALREAARGSAEQAVKEKLDAFYKDNLGGSVRNIRQNNYDAWDGGDR